MGVQVVTSFSFAGWQAYGRKCIDTFHKFWPRDIVLHVVSEDVFMLPQSILDHRELYMWNLMQSLPAAEAFYMRHKANDACRGKQRGGYSFRHDAWKFSKKVFAIKLIADCIIGGNKKDRLIWLDADTVTFAPVPLEMLNRMPPDNFALACLDRQKYHSECGWVAYNLANADAVRFINNFAGLYTNDAVFKLAEWHDSWVFDYLRKQLHTPTYSIPHKHAGHPFVYSELGNYMDHLKGARKNMGVSHEHPRFGRPTPPRDQQAMSARKKLLDEHVSRAPIQQWQPNPRKQK